jgi:hypothetical protein
VETPNPSGHAAEGAALGFYYQSLYALLAVQRLPHDDAGVVLERLDDVELTVEGGRLLSQLKHSLSKSPAKVTLTSRQLWDTLKVWVDSLPLVIISETEFRLVTVAPIDPIGPLSTLCIPGSERSTLMALLIKEAQRVDDEYTAALSSGSKKPPHKERINSCRAFLNLEGKKRIGLLDRVTIESGSPNIANITSEIEKTLVNFPPAQRKAIVDRLVQWWDMQVVFSLCGKRDRCLRKIEVLQQIAEISGEIERDELIPEFELEPVPEGHQHDSMLERQINLVNGSSNDLRIAIREEWRARSQRHKWINSRLDMATRITAYDVLLQESWGDKHGEICVGKERCNDDELSKRGQGLLKWALNDVQGAVRPFAPNWNAAYYVRGTLQVLAIDLKVGWHPNFEKLLGSES